MGAGSLLLLLASVAVAGVPTVGATAVQRDASLALDVEQRGNLVRREQLASRQVPGAVQPEVIDKILTGGVNGSAVVGESGEKQFWLEAGCRELLPNPALSGEWRAVGERVGKVQCCRDEPSNMTKSCYRKKVAPLGETCLSDALVSFSEAAVLCEMNGYRLCTKDELLDNSQFSSGCCRSGCGIDTAFVWTSTFSFKGVKDSNEALKAQIDEMKNDNLRIQQEHIELQRQLDGLQAVVRGKLKPADLAAYGYMPKQPPIPTITGEEAEKLARENSRLRYEVEAARRDNDNLKDHMIAIVNGTIVTPESAARDAARDAAARDSAARDQDHAATIVYGTTVTPDSAARDQATELNTEGHDDGAMHSDEAAMHSDAASHDHAAAMHSDVASHDHAATHGQDQAAMPSDAASHDHAGHDQAAMPSDAASHDHAARDHDTMHAHDHDPSRYDNSGRDDHYMHSDDPSRDDNSGRDHDAMHSGNDHAANDTGYVTASASHVVTPASGDIMVGSQVIHQEVVSEKPKSSASGLASGWAAAALLTVTAVL